MTIFRNAFHGLIASALCLCALATSAVAQSAGVLPNAKTQFLDANGNPLVGGKVYFYVPNTSTPKTTWQDGFQMTPNAQPVVLDSAGSAFIFGLGNYTETLYDSNGNLIWSGLSESPVAVSSLSLSGPLTIDSTADATNQGILVNMTGSQTGTVTSNLLYNEIIVTDDGSVVNSPGISTDALWVELDVANSNAKAITKEASRSIIVLSGSGIATGGDLIGQSEWCFAAATNGGTNTGAGAAGTCYGDNPTGWLSSGALNYYVVSGGEVDCVIQTGASAKNRWCWSIVGNGNLQGASTDAGLEFGSPVSSGSFKNLIFLDNIHGASPLLTTGCVLCTDGSGDTIATGIDLSAYLITGYFLRSEGFSVSGAGAIVGLSLTGLNSNNLVLDAQSGTLVAFAVNGTGIAAVGASNLYPLTDNATALGATSFRWSGVYAEAYFVGGGNTAGVTCSGSPTSSFASSLGIVTHC